MVIWRPIKWITSIKLGMWSVYKLSLRQTAEENKLTVVTNPVLRTLIALWIVFHFSWLKGYCFFDYYHLAWGGRRCFVCYTTSWLRYAIMVTGVLPPSLQQLTAFEYDCILQLPGNLAILHQPDAAPGVLTFIRSCMDSPVILALWRNEQLGLRVRRDPLRFETC